MMETRDIKNSARKTFNWAQIYDQNLEFVTHRSLLTTFPRSLAYKVPVNRNTQLPAESSKRPFSLPQKEPFLPVTSGVQGHLNSRLREVETEHTMFCQDMLDAGPCPLKFRNMRDTIYVVATLNINSVTRQVLGSFFISINLKARKDEIDHSFN